MTNAQRFIGSTGWGTGANTYCETFTEQMTGSGWQGASAIDAWNRQAAQNKTSTDLSNLQPGDALYFSPTATNPYGHTGIYAGNGQFVSATANGIQQYDIGNWLKATGQSLLGFVKEPGANGPSGIMGGQKAEGGNQPLPPALQTDGQGNLAPAPSGSGWAGNESPGSFFSRVGDFLQNAGNAVQSGFGAAGNAIGGGFNAAGTAVANALPDTTQAVQDYYVNPDTTGRSPTVGQNLTPAPLAVLGGLGKDIANAASETIGGTPFEQSAVGKTPVPAVAGIIENAPAMLVPGGGFEDAGASGAIDAASGAAPAALQVIVNAGGTVKDGLLAAGGDLAQKALAAVKPAITDAAGQGAPRLTDVLGSAADQAMNQALGDQAAPAIAGGSTTPVPNAIDQLNQLLGTFGHAQDASADPMANALKTSMMDNAGTVLAGDLGNAYRSLGLTPDENASVAELLEGQPLTRPTSVKAIQTAQALEQTFQNAAQMAQNAGTLDGLLENYFSHLVRFPEGQTPGTQALAQAGVDVPQQFSAQILNDWTRFAMGRLRNPDGSVRFPTVGDLQTYLAGEHPGAQVITDVPTVAEAHTAGLIRAANHAQFVQALNGYIDDSGYPAFGTTPRPGDVPVPNLPNSLAKWVRLGPGQEIDSTLLTDKGIVNPGGGSEIIQQQTPTYARPEVAQAINRYLAAPAIDPAKWGAIAKLGSAYQNLNQLLINAKLTDILIHGNNMVTETAKQALDPRRAPDFAGAERFMQDPVFRQEVLQKMPLNLSMTRNFRQALAKATGPIPAEPTVRPVLTGAQNAAAWLGEHTMDPMHQLLFDGIGQRAQVASALGYYRATGDPVLSAKLANSQFGQFSPQDLNAAVRWINDNLAFAGKWLTGRMQQWGSLMPGVANGKPVFGMAGRLNGYGADLTPEQLSAFNAELRGQQLRGLSMYLASHILLNKVLSGKYPWQNDPGRMLSLNTGQANAQGKALYMSDPLFKGEQDFTRLLLGTAGMLGVRVPGGIGAPSEGMPLNAGAGTTLEDLAANKAAPLLGTATSLAPALAGQAPTQYRNGPPIVAPNSTMTEAMEQGLADTWNQVAPSQLEIRYSKPTSACGLKAGAAGPLQMTMTTPVGTLGHGAQGWTAQGPNLESSLTGLAGANQSAGPRFTGSLTQVQQQQDAVSMRQWSPAAQSVFAASGIATPPAVGAGPVAVPGVKGVKVQFTAPEQQAIDAAMRPMIERQIASLANDRSFRALPPTGPGSRETYVMKAVRAAEDAAISQLVGKWDNPTWQARMAAAQTYAQQQAAQRLSNVAAQTGFRAPALSGAR